MSETTSSPKPSGFSDRATLVFVIILSVVSASILALLASSLKSPQEEARELDRSKELLLSAQIYNSLGYLQLFENGSYVPALQIGNGLLEPTKAAKVASKEDIMAVYRARVRPMLVNHQGALSTYEAQKINIDQYLADNKKSGFANLTWLPLFEILPNSAVQGGEVEGIKPIAYVIPVSGFGLWDFIGGYIAIKPDGKTVVGISWYEQKETPGLGANIAEADWQSQFPGKLIFQVDLDGSLNANRAPLGITVVRGKVKDVYGTGPKSLSAVDGMAGATLTGNGVTKAYKDSLEPYRAFFIELMKERT